MSAPARPVVLAAPSGTGKTTIARRLVGTESDFQFSVSATTRRPRQGERWGVDYHFLDRDAFKGMVARGELLEWAEVHGQFYGTPRRSLEEPAAAGRHVVLDIDVQGARQVRARVPDALLVFVLPPSAEALLERLAARGTEGPEDVARRLRTALVELDGVRDFDYVVVNDRIEDTVALVRDAARGGASLPTADEMEDDIARLREGVERVLRERFAGTAS
jgi:guanylate kinase